MREIQVGNGLVALVDDEDFALVSLGNKWHASKGRNTHYARRNEWTDGHCVTVRMHNYITGLAYVDHINGNGLDNRRSNLRAATDSQNAMNRGMRTDNSSGFKGVYRRGRLWRAQIQIQGRRVHLGTFDDATDAALAYDAVARIEYGEYGTLNFPKPGEQPVRDEAEEIAGPIYQGVEVA